MRSIAYYQFRIWHNLITNEIVRCTKKSSQCSDEICCADEIKSVTLPTKVGFHHEVISSIEDGFIPSKTDLVEKSTCIRKCFFLAPPAGIEPTSNP